MSGLFTFSAAGVAFLLIAAFEALLPFKPPLPPPLRLPSLRYLSILLLSSLFILHSLFSSLFLSSSDQLGPPLPLSSAASAAPFLLYSLSGLLLPSLSPLFPLLSLSAFSAEILLLSLRRKDPDGIESRYFDLLLVPSLLCLISTALSAARPLSPFPRLARAAGLALHGTWLIQMGFSFFSSAIAHGCFLHHRSSANYTIKCNGHPEYHRARAIATLQFNCHLALLVVAAVAIYSAAVAANSGGTGYKPLNKELRSVGNGELARFSLEDEDEDEEIEHGDVALPMSEIRNGFGGSH